MSVGIRELRNGLSRHLAEVRSGRTITVTDHGVPIARISPVQHPNAMERLIAEGRLERARQPKKPAGDRVRSGQVVSDLIAGQRR